MEIEDEGHLLFLDIDIYRKTDGSLGHKNPITIQPTNTQASHPWYIEQQLYATKNLYHLNSHSSPMSLNKTVTATSRYNEP